MITTLGNKTHHMVDLERLTHGPVSIIDAGASYGEFIKALGDHIDIKPSEYRGYEPCKGAFRVVTEKYPGLRVWPLALVGEATRDLRPEIDFTEFVGPKGRYHQWGNLHGWYRGKVSKGCATKTYPVVTTSLSRICRFYDVKQIDYLKMDIEGSEESVILEMDQEMADRIGQMSFEIHRDKKLPQVLAKLKQLGFTEIIKEGAEVYASR